MIGLLPADKSRCCFLAQPCLLFLSKRRTLSISEFSFAWMLVFARRLLPIYHFIKRQQKQRTESHRKLNFAAMEKSIERITKLREENIKHFLIHHFRYAEKKI